MKQPLKRPALQRRLIRIGVILLALGVLCGAALIVGWIRAGGDPSFVFSTRRGGMPIWLMTIWIGSFGTLLCWFGVSKLRDAALLRKDAATGPPSNSGVEPGDRIR